jgi:CCR4-NOT transcriptional regulation complex NOT5 subunit
VFRSVPAQGQPVQLQRVLAMNQALESANASISMAVPAVVNAVSGTFLTQTRENSYNFNNFKLERPDNITSLQMNYNDTTNAYQTFSLRNHQEILHNYLESMRGAGINDSKLSKINANDCYGIGIDFKENIDFSQGNKFSVQLDSGIDSSNPVILFLYFHSVVNV